MHSVSSKFVHFLLWCLWLGVSSAPHNQEREETDPELTGGYFEGDMDVVFQRNGLLAPIRHWPNATVYYKIAPEFDEEHVEFLLEAMQRIQNVSCIRFEPATEENFNYIYIAVSSSCNSNVGLIGGRQMLKLRNDKLHKGCFKFGVIQHELLHALGFLHQQNSPNRNEYVKILDENIMAGKAHNFAKTKLKHVGDYGVPYDYGSVLHYSQFSFSKNGEPTIIAVHPEGQTQMGQRIALSKGDVTRLNNMYKCQLETESENLDSNINLDLS